MENTGNKFSWRLFWILLAAGLAGVAAVIPFAIDMKADPLGEAVALTPLVVLGSLAQNGIVLAALVWAGLRLAQKTGLRAPLLENIAEGKGDSVDLKSWLPTPVLAGLGVGVVIVVLDYLFFLMNIGVTLNVYPAVWKGFLAAFYGGITEEIITRLFLVSLLAWVSLKLWKSGSGMPADRGMWAAIVGAAVIFGLGHLPITARIAVVTPVVVLRAVVLNGVAGTVFGWFYWKNGLESAMLAHFSADIVLYVIWPAIFR